MVLQSRKERRGKEKEKGRGERISIKILENIVIEVWNDIKWLMTRSLTFRPSCMYLTLVRKYETIIFYSREYRREVRGVGERRVTF